MAGPRRDVSKTARDIFVNRDGPIGMIERAVDGLDDADRKVLVFYGPGGQGKTALCRYMAKHLPVAARAENGTKLRVAELDLHGRDKSDPDLLLARIRNGFVRAGVICPAFDLAFAIAWQEYRPEEPFPKIEKAWLAKNRDLIGDGAVDIVTALGGSAEEMVGSIPLLGPLIKHSANWFMDRSKSAWLHHTHDYLAELYSEGRLKKPYELSDLMPWMLAQDLNDHLSGHTGDRFVLLVDEYERVFDQGGAGKQWGENSFDRLMREVVAETNGLLAIFFTRERLPWEDDPDWQADLAGCQHALEGLKDPDAEQWLEKAGVTDAALRAAMIDGARDSLHTKALAYPLFLDLQIAYWKEIKKRHDTPKPEDFKVTDPDFSARCRTILHRLLRDYGEAWEYTLQRLCVADRFDKAAFDHVIDSFGTGLAKDAFDRLAGLSFVSADETGFLTLHRAIRDVLRSSLEAERRRETAAGLLAHYEPRATLPSPKDINETHRLALFEAVALRQQLGAEDFVSWLSRLMEPFRVAAWARTGELIWRDALGFIEENLDEEHPDTAASYNNLAYNLNAQGRYAEAERLYRKGLEIIKQALGDTHPNTAASYNNVAANLDAQGRYKEAEPLHRKGLEIRKQMLGDTHHDTATSHNNIALNLDAQGRYKEAEPLHRKGLEIRKQTLGDTHHDTAASYNNVAANLNKQGRYVEAEPLYRKGLEISKQALGEAHPDTATSYNNVAANLNAQGCYDEAGPLFRRGLEIRKQTLGEVHPDTAKSYNNVAANLNAQGCYDEAEPLFRKGLEICKQTLGETHPDTATSYNNVAGSLNVQERYAEAEPLYRKGLEIRKQTLGETHPDTAWSYNNVAYNLNAQGRYDEAEPLLRKAVEIMERALDPDNPRSVKLRRNLETFLAKRP